MFFERKAARLLGCRLEPVLFNPHIRALHTTTWGISTLKRLLQHTIWHKKTGSVQITKSLIKIYQVEIVSVKSDRKTLWALQRSCNDQRSAKLTVSSEEGKLIAILATMSTSTPMRSLSSRSASGRSIHLLQKESERCFLKYFWTLPILEIFHSSDVSC